MTDGTCPNGSTTLSFRFAIDVPFRWVPGSSPVDKRFLYGQSSSGHYPKDHPAYANGSTYSQRPALFLSKYCSKDCNIV